MSVEEKVRTQLLALYDEFKPRITELEHAILQTQQELDRVYRDYFAAQQEVFDENY